jgi:hypothetical protein
MTTAPATMAGVAAPWKQRFQVERILGLALPEEWPVPKMRWPMGAAS